MKNRNQVIYTIRQMLGDDRPNGFILDVNENLSVPNFLFKDAPAEYPEIRITPFLVDEQIAHPRREQDRCFSHKMTYHHAKFQVDIYSTSIPMVNNIYDALEERIDLFNELDIIRYGYDGRFVQVNDDENLFVNEIYSSNDFVITKIKIQKYILNKRDSIEDLEEDTWYLDKNGLYIKTNKPLKKIQVYSVIDGLCFSNGDTAYSRGILNTKILNAIMLSDLEDNKVERISFEMDIVYMLDRKRKLGPKLEDIKYINE